MPPEERRGLLLVSIAVLLFSTTPVLVVWADPMPSILKTWGRLALAALAVSIAAWVQSRRLSPDAAPATSTERRRRVLVAFMAYGLIAAVHFYCYVTALSFTTAAHALAIVYTAPVFITLASALFLHEPLNRLQWGGVVLAVLGIAVLAGLEPRMNPAMAFGDLLALVSALAFALYSIAGRYERQRHPLLVYASRVYVAAALWLLLPALAAAFAAPPDSWGTTQVAAVVALGLGPLALGHTLYNASLRRVHATYVNIIASQEVTGGIILSWLFLGQVPSLNALVGALIALTGTALVLKH